MEIHTCLWNDVAAFDFNPGDLARLERELGATVAMHSSHEAFLANSSTADIVLTWDFLADWYAKCPRLKAVITPAAGDDWVSNDPSGRVRLVHGTFHGPILAESLAQAILFMNHAMPDMVRNFMSKSWDRNLQHNCSLLADQTVMILGLGHIGCHAANYLRPLCKRVIGIKRDLSGTPVPVPGVEIASVDQLETVLPSVDHAVVLLPGALDTNRILDVDRLKQLKKGAFVYNFGRGNAVATDDLLAVRDHIGGAFLDVVDEEPLPADSPLWAWDQVMITPHSSCVYRNYKPRFIDEVITTLRKW